MFLPCTLWGEKTGTVTNLEGRVQRVGRKVAPEGTAMDDWRIAVELALRLGTDFDLATVDEVTDEIARVAPALAGATAALLRRARDGVVLPLREHLDEIVLRTRDLSILADDGPGTSWDPIKVEGEARRRESSARTARRGRPGADAAADGQPGAAANGTGAVPSAERARRATRTLCASWSAARSTTAGASSPRRPSFARLVRRRRRCASTRTTWPRSASTSGTEVQGHVGARHRSTRPGRAPIPRVPVGVAPLRLPRRRRRRRAAHRRRRRRSPTCGWRRCDESRVLALDPLFNGGDVTWSVFAVVADQGRRRVRRCCSSR